MKVGFFPNMGKENIVEVLQKTLALCKANGMTVYLPKDLKTYDLPQQLGIPEEQVLPRTEIFDVLDLAFSFGGDGTIIHLSRQITPRKVPVCGINLGELGFLNQIQVSELEEYIPRVAAGEYRVEQRAHLRGAIRKADGSEILLTPIMNEVMVSKVEPGKMARIILSINEGQTQMYPADGLIVSTATGSTGYNLSAGGPIMAPDNRSIIITPIAPHLLQNVSLVLKESARVDITMPEREKQLHICVDGTFNYLFTNKDSLHIETDADYCYYVRFKEKKFFATLFDKLNARRNSL